MSIYTTREMAPETVSLMRKLSKKIIKEHFNMTLVSDRNMNYLWYTYNEGVFNRLYGKPFILACELMLLAELNVITQEEKESLFQMIGSDDADNHYMALLAIQKFRKDRIKIHGEWTEQRNVSALFQEVVSSYPTKVVNFSKIAKTTI